MHFIRADVLASALNALLGRRQAWCGDTLDADELTFAARATFIYDWCRKRELDIRKLKASLAQEALDIGRNSGSLLEPARAEQLHELHVKLLAATEATTRS